MKPGFHATSPETNRIVVMLGMRKSHAGYSLSFEPGHVHIFARRSIQYPSTSGQELYNFSNQGKEVDVCLPHMAHVRISSVLEQHVELIHPPNVGSVVVGNQK